MLRPILLFGLILLMSGGAIAGIIKVPDQYATIQSGINAAFPGDTVLVADGTYYENIDFKDKAITVTSYYLFDGDTTHVDSTIIDGSQPADPNKGSVVSFVSGEDTTSVLYGFTITGGSGWWQSTSGSREGGGIYCYNSGCKIVANKITNNSITGPVALGGGLAALPPPGSSAYVVLKENQIAHNLVTANSLYAMGGGLLLCCDAKLTANVISYNSCIADPNAMYAEGGGISFQPQSIYLEIIMENNTITHNSISSYGKNIPSGYGAAWGGGVGMHACKGRMIKNEISYNEIWNYSNTGVTAIGVAVADSPDSFLVEANIIRDNVYQQTNQNCFGGGLELQGTGIISVINNLIEGNHATHGGGVEIAHNITNPGTAVLINNTIVNNTSTYGGGISVRDATSYVMNTIVWGNQAPTHPGIYVESGSIQVAYCDVQGGWTGIGNINLDPQSVADSLSNSSPCIGNGIASYDFGGGMMCYCPRADIAGKSRPDPVGSNPDMGDWESPLKDPITEVLDLALAEIQQSYFLSQNYPNPFNPSTTIEFALPKASFVTLKVYNLIGEPVATLVAERRAAGAYKANWDARGLTSGVYWCRLQADEFTQTRKLILLR